MSNEDRLSDTAEQSPYIVPYEHTVHDLQFADSSAAAHPSPPESQFVQMPYDPQLAMMQQQQYEQYYYQQQQYEQYMQYSTYQQSAQQQFEYQQQQYDQYMQNPAVYQANLAQYVVAVPIAPQRFVVESAEPVLSPAHHSPATTISRTEAHHSPILPFSNVTEPKVEFSFEFPEIFNDDAPPPLKPQWMICGAASVVIAIILSVVAYVYLPRFPQIHVYSIDLSNIGGSNSPYSFTYKTANHSLNNIRLQMNLTMNVGTFNPNAYDLNIDTINLVAQMIVNNSIVDNPLKTLPISSFASLVQLVGIVTPPPGYHGLNDSVVGTGYHGSIIFPAKSTINYTMQFQLDYSPDPLVGLINDPTIKEIASACGITSRLNETRRMHIHYTATSVIGALKPFGFSPQLSNDLFISCPFSPSQISAVLQKAQNGVDPFTAIQQVFGGEPGVQPVNAEITGPEDGTVDTAAGVTTTDATLSGNSGLALVTAVAAGSPVPLGAAPTVPPASPSLALSTTDAASGNIQPILPLAPSPTVAAVIAAPPPPLATTTEQPPVLAAAATTDSGSSSIDPPSVLPTSNAVSSNGPAVNPPASPAKPAAIPAPVKPGNPTPGKPPAKP
ncbi:hypothetical protein HDU98_002477 [Podochytrium sp. JEL0797]|nr:hypothetical protein HDU98_002477 [Podochytrium sp. JEL0797]